MNGFIRGRQLGLCAGLLLLAGCAGFSRDGGFAVVEQAAEQQLDKQLSWSKTPEERTLVAERVTELLAQPLSADAAVQIALLNNRGGQASFDQLGISEAERIQAGRIPNPGFSFGRLEQGSETRKIAKLIPDYMVMGECGMADMAEMQMPLPDNTAPMMTGDGPFGSVEMGGMFTMLKVRKEQPPGDYRDPGWFKHPAGSVAREWQGPLAEPARAEVEGGQSMPLQQPPSETVEVQVRKPSGHAGH